MKFRDNTGAPIFEPAAAGPAVSTGPAGCLFGDDVWFDSDVATPASAVKGWLFGDLSAMKVVDVGGLNISVSREVYFGDDSYGIRAVREVASDLPDTTAIAYQVAADT